MKKCLIIGIVFAFSISFDVGRASNVITIEKQHDLKESILSHNKLMAYDYVVISDCLEYSKTEPLHVLTPVAVLPKSITIDETKLSYLDYKQKGKLKSKVNNFHLFYRAKLC